MDPEDEYFIFNMKRQIELIREEVEEWMLTLGWNKDLDKYEDWKEELDTIVKSFEDILDLVYEIKRNKFDEEDKV